MNCSEKRGICVTSVGIMHCANVFCLLNTSDQNVLFFQHLWHLVSFAGQYLFRCISFPHLRHDDFLVIRHFFPETYGFWCFVVACLLLLGFERIASTLVVTPGGLHRTTACCFLTASFWSAWSTARFSVRLGYSCSFF